MRTSLWIAIALLVVTICASLLEVAETRGLSQRYVSASEEILVMVEKQDWARAAETVAAYLESWEQTVPWLQILINHDDIDDVTLSLMRLEAGIRAGEKATCYEACAELKENARHIHHRDAFTLGNVL
ncbi:MAG: DUF4363 family protein [Clostridiales bacterium]|nr:DUF4363 family protein [Clostridiales bacterium]